MTHIVHGLGVITGQDTLGIRQHSLAGCQAKEGIPIKHGVRRSHGPCQAIVCHLCNLLSLDLGYLCIGCDNTDGCIGNGRHRQLLRQPDASFSLITILILYLRIPLPYHARIRVYY